MDPVGPEAQDAMEIEQEATAAVTATAAATPRAAPHENVPADSPSIVGQAHPHQPLSNHEICFESLDRVFHCFEEEANTALVRLEEAIGNMRTEEEDTFLPSQIFIRDDMKRIFQYFRRDVLGKNSNRVLLGSPGVGKSVLFFIAALYKAVTLATPIAYLRQTREEKAVSVFVMFRTLNGVRVFWGRDLSKRNFPTINNLGLAVMQAFGREFVFFLDGPRHDAELHLNAFYDYFCTSGGHPLPKNAQKDLFLWILDGWKEAEVQAFGTLLGNPEAYADAYRVCGGCIRDIISLVDGDGEEKDSITTTLAALAQRVSKSPVDLVLNTTSRNNDNDMGNPDRLRTMFNGRVVPATFRIPDAMQIIDSAYVLQLLRGRLSMDNYFMAMRRGKAIQNGSVVGVYFEEILHQWFKDTLPSDISQVCASSGTAAEGLEMLVEKNTYWIPSVGNFPNIDAAAVLGSVLYCYQYTKSSVHGFNVGTFWQGFVTAVRSRLEFDRVHVYIVLPDKVTSTLVVEFRKTWTSGTRSSADRVEIVCTSSYVNVDTTTVGTIRSSALAGFSATQG